VIAGVIDGERPGTVQVLGLVAAIVGVVLASGPELSGEAGVRPLVLAAFAAVGFGLSLTFLAKGSESSVPLTLMLMRASSLIVVVVIALVVRSVGGVRPRDLVILAGVGVGDVSANLCFALASTRGLLSLVSVAGSLYPVATIALARFVHHERLARIQYAGVVGAIAGVALIAAGGA
jgi:drug/metabolite transporter (DMT)-like permease